MRRCLELMLISLAFAVSGCESCDSCTGVGPGIGAGEGEPLELEETTDEDAGAERAGEPTSIKEAASKFAEGMSLLDSAIDAGIETEEGDSPCERSLTGMSGLFRYLKENADDPGAIVDAPNSLVFMHVCEGLPLEAQRCMVLSYAKENAEECQRVYQGLTPEQQEQIQGVGPSRRR